MISCALVTAGYGRSPVLHGVTLGFGEGQLTGILGPNGAGKSTLLRVLARLLPPASGAVRLDGRDLYAGFREREAAHRVALVPQEESYPYPLTVRELVELGRTPHLGPFGYPGRHDAIAVDRAIAEMDLSRLAGRLVAELSGGERKRAQVARALAQEARILALDEPTVHMDVAHAIGLFGLLRRLAAAGRTVIVASHELWQLARYCDRLVLLKRGRLVMDGPPNRVLAARECSAAFGVRMKLLRAGGMMTPVVLGVGRRVRGGKTA